MEKQLVLLRDYEHPQGAVRKGVVKTEREWMEIFDIEMIGLCETKTDWFKLVLPKTNINNIITCLIDKGFYWVKPNENDSWEIARWDIVNKVFWGTNNYFKKLNTIFEVDTNEITRTAEMTSVYIIKDDN